jgi:hypothetical protein
MKILDRILDKLRDYPHQRRSFMALHHRLLALEEEIATHRAQLKDVTRCARCRVLIAVGLVDRDGPVLVERFVNDKRKLAFVCWYCEGTARRLGWKPVKTAPVKQEAAS